MCNLIFFDGVESNCSPMDQIQFQVKENKYFLNLDGKKKKTICRIYPFPIDELFIRHMIDHVLSIKAT